MMNKSFAKASALGSVALGLLAASFMAGCAADSGQPSDNSSGTPEKADITLQSQVAKGCGAVSTFAISSPNVINWVALDQSNLANVNNIQLYNVDDNNQVSNTNQTVTNANSTVQSMINQATNNMSAQQAWMNQYAQNMASNQSTATNSSNAADVTSVNGFNNSAATTNTAVTHQDNHNNNQWASASNYAANISSAAQQAS